MMRAAQLALELFLLLPGLLTAQQDTLSRLAGTARSAFNGRPLAGVMVAVPAVPTFAVTDSTGAFDLRLPPGRHTIRIAYRDRKTTDHVVELRPGRTKRIEMVLDVEAVELAPIVIEGRASVWRTDLAGFYQRRRSYGGFGRFFTEEDIERRGHTSLRLLLAGAGVQERCSGVWGCAPSVFWRGRLCSVSVAVDGMPAWETDYANIPIEDVAGVEVYRNPMWIPADLSGLGMMVGPSGMASSSGLAPGSCGAIAIWTRE
jgi:carboxypeptidase family protein